MINHYSIRWQHWAAKQGKGIRNQAHGSPANILDLYAVSDVPEIEGVFLRRAAVETQLSVYFMYRIAAEKKIELDLEADFLREYVYQNLLKLLG